MIRDSDEEEGNGSRSRSRSPLGGGRGMDNEDSSDSEALTPQSEKIARIVEKVVAAQLAPIKRNLNKVMDTSSQLKSIADQTKRGVIDVRKSNAQIEDHLKKASREDPKSSLSPLVITKLNASVLENLQKGKNKEQIQAAVFEELMDRATISPTDEISVKSVAATEFRHLKSHLRGLVSQDLSLDNYLEMPKTMNYIRSHLKIQTVENSTKEFGIIMGLGLAKFENARNIPMSELDKGNLARITENLDNFWVWVTMKFTKFQETGNSLEGKLKSIMANYGYQAKKSDRPVRRSSQ